MNAMQTKLMDMLKWFHGFCEENNLRYYAVGGTMLGAMRHKGFIPWDDDIDVGMPRSDYNRLIQLLGDQPQGNYILEAPEMCGKCFYYPYSKIYDITTTLIENTKYKIERGIYIDVFPLDGIGNSLEEAAENYKKIEKLHRLLITRVATVRKGRGLYKNAAVLLMRAIPNFIFNPDKLLKDLNTACAAIDFDGVEYVANLVGTWWGKEIVPRAFFGKPIKLAFENAEICGVEKPDEYLTALYGNWRKLPPAEKRVSHHANILLDLERPYTRG